MSVFAGQRMVKVQCHQFAKIRFSFLTRAGKYPFPNIRMVLPWCGRGKVGRIGDEGDIRCGYAHSIDGQSISRRNFVLWARLWGRMAMKRVS